MPVSAAFSHFFMIELFFGLPGCGKTSLLAYFARRELQLIRRGKSSYKNVYSNVAMSLPGLIAIDNECIGKYDLSHSLLLIDEATLFADSRDFKQFGKDKISFFLLHRHYKCDIKLFTQQWDGVDRKIRVITDRVYYVYKGLFTGFFITKFYRIPYGIIIPDKKTGGEKLGEIIQGYCKPSFLQRLFSHRIFRPMLYRYFDSFEAPKLDPLPSRYSPYVKPEKLKKLDRARGSSSPDVTQDVLQLADETHRASENEKKDNLSVSL